MGPHVRLVLLPLLLLPLPLARADQPPAAEARAEEAAAEVSAQNLSWSRSRLGLKTIVITPSLRAHYGAPEQLGVLVAEVVPDSPADQAGLQVGDVLIEVNGQEIDSRARLASVLRNQPAGTLQVTVVRYGKLKIFSARFPTVQGGARILVQLPADGEGEREEIEIRVPDLQERMQVMKAEMESLEADLLNLQHRVSEELEQVEEELEDEFGAEGEIRIRWRGRQETAVPGPDPETDPETDPEETDTDTGTETLASESDPSSDESDPPPADEAANPEENAQETSPEPEGSRHAVPPGED